METIQATISCPQCGSAGFNRPDPADPHDLADGRIACASCGRVLTVEDVSRTKAAAARSFVPNDPVSASVAQAVRDILK